VLASEYDEQSAALQSALRKRKVAYAILWAMVLAFEWVTALRPHRPRDLAIVTCCAVALWVVLVVQIRLASRKRHRERERLISEGQLL
jgi:peptidoglycan/LPS O-acetylase OafA/YrhL